MLHCGSPTSRLMIPASLALPYLFLALFSVPAPMNSVPISFPRAPAHPMPVGDMNSTHGVAQRLTCVFETGQSQLSTDYLENLGDGRGYTCGWAGFTTADEEVVQCVEAYTRQVPGNPLAPLLPELRRLQAGASDDVSGLDEAGFPALWREASKGDEFNRVYASVVHRIFGEPTLEHIRQLGLQSPVAYAILFDSCIQHGDGSDPDSLPSMIERTRQTAGEPGEDETAWLQAFLETRRQTLLHPHNLKTQAEWSRSVSRVDALSLILRQNPRLQLPLRVKSREHDEEIN